MNARQQKFVIEYLVDQIGWKAADRAGYKGSEKTLGIQAVRLLSNARIKAAVDAGLAKQLAKIEKKAELTKEKWLERLETIGFSDIGEAFHTDERGKIVMTIDQMKKSGFSKLVRKIKVLPGGKVEVDLHAVLPALELIGKTFGWVKDSVEHSGSISRPVETSEEQFRKLHSTPELAKASLLLAEALVPPPAAKPAEGVKK